MDCKMNEQQYSYHKNIYECEVCTKVFPRANQLIGHLTVHTDEESYSCELCRKTFRFEQSCKKHVLKCIRPRRNDKKLYSCELCLKSYSRSSTLIDHMTFHTDERSYSCKLCAKAFHFKSNRNKHRRKCSKLIANKEDTMQSELGQKPYLSEVCEVCFKPFWSARSLINHLTYHTNERPFSCTWCSKSFLTKDYLKNHCRNVHDALFCRVCPESFLAMEELEKHSITHCGQFSCSKCPNLFLSVDELKKHELTHTARQTYNCPQCSASFSDKTNYDQHHLDVHGCFLCKICLKGFLTQEQLTDHESAHTEGQTFNCPQCSATFSLKSECDQHYLNMHGFFLCKICSQLFFKQEQLKIHELTHATKQKRQRTKRSNSFAQQAEIHTHLQMRANDRWIGKIDNNIYTQLLSSTESSMQNSESYTIKNNVQETNSQYCAVEPTTALKVFPYNTQSKILQTQEKSENRKEQCVQEGQLGAECNANSDWFSNKQVFETHNNDTSGARKDIVTIKQLPHVIAQEIDGQIVHNFEKQKDSDTELHKEINQLPGNFETTTSNMPTIITPAATGVASGPVFENLNPGTVQMITILTPSITPVLGGETQMQNTAAANLPQFNNVTCTEASAQMQNVNTAAGQQASQPSQQLQSLQPISFIVLDQPFWYM